MKTNYEFKMSVRDHVEYKVDVMTMFVNGKEVGRADVVNIHETFSERCSQVRRELIYKYEWAR
jgi:hypothetical protein